MRNTVTLPVSSVPAAFDREHLYSPSAGTAELIEHRPGDVFGPLPTSPRGNPTAWKEWWTQHASTPTPDYLGLKAGDEITIQHASTTGPGTVLSTCRFGAIVRYPMPKGTDKPHSEMYVTARNQHGHWYR
ncbi:hypothetical protein [Streptomyces sp. NPDC046371]|uniref:hypothetical protein n=1 Tax=Streptomyces sp. NPDC046371 TaxID=3154916 RepID=UPI0033DC09D8